MRLGVRIAAALGWLKRNYVLIASVLFSACTLGLMSIWSLQPDLVPLVGSNVSSILMPNLTNWHWVGAWLSLGTFVLLSSFQLVGRVKGAFFCSLLAMLVSSIGWAILEYGSPNQVETAIQGLMLSAFWGGWIVLQLTTFDLIWLGDDSDERWWPKRNLSDHNGRSFREHFVFLFFSLIGLTLIASLWIWPGANLGQRQAFDSNWSASLVFSLLVITAFFPLLRGNWLSARAHATAAKRAFWRKDVVSPLSFVVIVSTLIAVSSLAYFAAKYVSEEISVAISYATFVGVFVLFLVVISTPHILNYHRYRNEKVAAQFDQYPPAMAGLAIPLHTPAQWLSYLDTFMVKVIAPLSGGTQKRFAHVHVILILSFLSLLGLVLPRPFGLVPIVIGILLAIALGRRWAWIEEDRETASRLEQTNGSNIHLGFESDLKDEALTGYVGLFILVPLTLYQIQDITGFQPRLAEQSGNILFVWIAFFGGELAKAVPFVDWWDIYGNSDLSSTGKHLTFASRAAVDLIILAALFQALKIWQRNRVQTTLYADGHLEAFDPFKEQEFFSRGVIRLAEVNTAQSAGGSSSNQEGPLGARIEQLRKEKRLIVLNELGARSTYFEVRKSFIERIEEHVKARGKILRESSSVYESPAPYSRQRLAELIKQSHDQDLRAGAHWMIDRWSVLVGTPLDQLGQIAQRWQTLQFPADNDTNAFATINFKRIQKMEFERILVELASSNWINRIRQQDVSDLMNCLHRVRKEVEFDFSRILALEIFARLNTVYAVLFLSKFVMTSNHLEKNEDWRRKLIAKAEGPNPEMRLGRAEMRMRAYDAAAGISLNPSANDQARREAHCLLELMAGGDGAEDSTERARDLAEKCRSTLEAEGLI